MKTRITALFFACLLAMGVCLGACSNSKIHSISNSQAEEGVITESTAMPESVQGIQHIRRDLSEYLCLDADILSPQTEYMYSYRLGSITLNPDTAKTVFFPNNPSTIISYEGDWGAYNEGEYVIEDQNGNKFSNVAHTISFSTSDLQKRLEQEDLLKRYSDAHLDEIGVDLAFMSIDDAVALGNKAIESCGISFTPILEKCIGLEHENIIAWQQELLSDKNNDYNTFGKAIILSNLTGDDDAYYLSYTFTYDGIPIYGPNEPAITYADAVLPPTPISAEMLITPQGIQHFIINSAYSISEVQEENNILSVEDAISKFKETFDSFILTQKNTISSIYLEYMPEEHENYTILKPYWCFDYNFPYEGNDGRTYWTSMQSERYNAFTGENIRYGG